MNCRLCQKASLLRNSHIIPEFLYKPLYNEKGHMMAINGRGHKGWKPLQKGLREYLFCEECEQFFNDQYEKNFKTQWIDNTPLPSIWPKKQDQIVVTVNYTIFKLFHLCVLYRAGVSSLPTFSEVRLGPHEKKIRTMLLEQDAGNADQYPITGIAMLDPNTHHIMHQVITMPIRDRLYGQPLYSIAYGGINWWIGVSSHLNSNWRAHSLKPDGKLPLISMPWTELGITKRASRLLKSE